ncbi:MAG TPA: hypothetical protein GYA08_00670 [Chloroflexi bacterium]|nr:hypothetical protein [Chloroflexota bacterium]
MAEQWHDNGTPLVSPDAKFRADLHRALQATHQRQQGQRQRSGDTPARQLLADGARGLAAFGLVALVFALGYALGQRSASTSRRG